MAALILALVESDIGVDSLEDTDLALKAGLGSLEKATGVSSLDVVDVGVGATFGGEGSFEKLNSCGGVLLGCCERGEGSLENPNAGGGGFLSKAGGWNGEASLDLGVLVPPEGREKEIPAEGGGNEEAGGGAAGAGTGIEAGGGGAAFTAGSSVNPGLFSPARATSCVQRGGAPGLKLRQ